VVVNMSYDYGLKKISKHTGLTGIEAKNIAQAFKTKNLDVETVDWETIGGDLYGHGSRVGGVKHHLKNMYAIDLSSSESSMGSDLQVFDAIYDDNIRNDLMGIHERRSKASRFMDINRKAKQTFKPSNKAGVKKWRKNPNRFDIIGIDDPIEF